MRCGAKQLELCPRTSTRTKPMTEVWDVFSKAFFSFTEGRILTLDY